VEIASGVHLITGEVGGRPLQLALLLGAQRVVLLDSGTALDPHQIIFPYLDSIGLLPTDVDLVITTHPDSDHCGGNGAMKQANPDVLLSCGAADRPLVEDPEAMVQLRYNRYAEPHDIQYDQQMHQHIREMLGRPQPVDFTWTGGETIRLDSDWTVEIHHTPGHSLGHLTIYDGRSRLALTGDAVQGAVYLNRAGQPALCPTYTDVDAYLGTIRYLRHLGADMLVGCHWPVKRGDEVVAFLDECAQFVDLADRLLLATLARSSSGASLRELIAAVGPQLGDWPRETDQELVYALAGHMDRFVARGAVIADTTTRPYRYRVV
jgi:glyoxylase-like metal-dependent hydrolase (beta-lactamase superfamily II)